MKNEGMKVIFWECTQHYCSETLQKEAFIASFFMLTTGMQRESERAS
jgi:hypothetical protein